MANTITIHIEDFNKNYPDLKDDIKKQFILDIAIKQLQNIYALIRNKKEKKLRDVFKSVLDNTDIKGYFTHALGNADGVIDKMKDLVDNDTTSFANMDKSIIQELAQMKQGDFNDQMKKNTKNIDGFDSLDPAKNVVYIIENAFGESNKSSILGNDDRYKGILRDQIE